MTKISCAIAVTCIALVFLNVCRVGSTPIQATFLTQEDLARGQILLAKPDNGPGFDYTKEGVLSENQNLRNAIRRRRWSSSSIPYVISPLYTQTERSAVAAAIQEYHTKTCIRFIPRTNQVDYLYITPDDGMGQQVSPYCYSHVGKMGGKQFVKMYGECVRVQALIHELGHAIGFEHEHNRPDRDSYINILTNNIDPVYNYAYQKVSSVDYDTLGLVYDYYSIMHYPDYSFARAGLKAFTLRFPGNLSSENTRLSPTDVQKINKYYGC